MMGVKGVLGRGHSRAKAGPLMRGLLPVLPSPFPQARLERDLSNKKIYQEEEMPESGAGSEFNRKLREEARRKKHGIVLKEFRPEDQPWLLRVNGKSGRR